MIPESEKLTFPTQKNVILFVGIVLAILACNVNVAVSGFFFKKSEQSFVGFQGGLERPGEAKIFPLTILGV